MNDSKAREEFIARAMSQDIQVLDPQPKLVELTSWLWHSAYRNVEVEEVPNKVRVAVMMGQNIWLELIKTDLFGFSYGELDFLTTLAGIVCWLEPGTTLSESAMRLAGMVIGAINYIVSVGPSSGIENPVINNISEDEYEKYSGQDLEEQFSKLFENLSKLETFYTDPSRYSGDKIDLYRSVMLQYRAIAESDAQYTKEE